MGRGKSLLLLPPNMVGPRLSVVFLLSSPATPHAVRKGTLFLVQLAVLLLQSGVEGGLVGEGDVAAGQGGHEALHAMRRRCSLCHCLTNFLFNDSARLQLGPLTLGELLKLQSGGNDKRPRCRRRPARGHSSPPSPCSFSSSQRARGPSCRRLSLHKQVLCLLRDRLVRRVRPLQHFVRS